MKTVDHEVNRYLTLLRDKIRDHGFTQLEVQEALGWGRSYISQLLTRQKNLRVEQVLLILSVIGSSPSEFFGELYTYGSPYPVSYAAPPVPPETAQALAKLRRELHELVDLLLEKQLITAEDLSEAVATVSE